METTVCVSMRRRDEAFTRGERKPTAPSVGVALTIQISVTSFWDTIQSAPVKESKLNMLTHANFSLTLVSL